MHYIPEGFLFSSANAKIKYENRNDVGLIYCPNGVKVSAVFTKNKIKAAPVLYSQNLLKNKSNFKAIIINSGNANACTGEQGVENCKIICSNIAKKLKIHEHDVLISSTGVIGVPLPVKNFLNISEPLIKNLTKEEFINVAKAIMTTDTIHKIYSVKKDNFTIFGFAKGAGMINPDMATMLAFILTDADIDKNLMDDILKRVVDKTFNSITVDGDMSTNDSVFLMSNRLKKNINIDEFEKSLYEVALNLAQMIVRDGEGATKFVKILVRNGTSEKQCKNIAKSVANSLLVKTAIFGGDPNWGRIIAAVGYSGENFISEKLDIYFGDYKIVENGAESENFSEKRCAQYLKKNKDINIIIDLNEDDKNWEYYTCDITYDYVKINAEYRT